MKKYFKKIYRCSTAVLLFLLLSPTMHLGGEKNKFFAFRREQLEVHNSLSVEMKSAIVCGQLPFLAPWQDKASGDTFVNALSLYALEVDSPPACLTLSPLSISTFPHPLLLPSPCIPPIMGLTDTRHQQVLWRPRWIRFPACQEIVLHVHFYGLVLHSWRFSLVCCHVR